MTDTILDDPYYGLLSEPPGLWSVTSYGSGTKLVVLQGSPDFHRKAHNLLDSFGGGRQTAENTVNISIKMRPIIKDVVAISITEERLLKALELYFYGQIYEEIDKELIMEDEDGCIVEIKIPESEETLIARAKELAISFYESVMKTQPLPVDPMPDRGDGMSETRWLPQSGPCSSASFDDDESALYQPENSSDFT